MKYIQSTLGNFLKKHLVNGINNYFKIKNII